MRLRLLPAPAARHGGALLRILVVLFVAGLVAAGLVARWYFGRRAHLTSEWREAIGERGAAVSLEGAVSVADTPPIELPEEHVLMRISGDSSGDYFGWSVAGLGDVSGDGTPDFAVGAIQLDNDAPRPSFDIPSGYARVFSGKDGSELYTLHPEGSLHVDSSDDMFGVSLAGLDDVDGDGAPDLAVGSFLYDFEDPDESEVDENTGATFVFSGRSGERLRLLGGERWGDRFGFSLAAFPDHDGDGKGDLLVGVEKGETTEAVKNAGRAEVWSTGSWERLVVANGPGFEGRMGHSVVALPDLDGDGVAELASGAYMYGAREKSEMQRGAVGLFSGADGSLLRAFEGEAMVDNLGKALAALGDGQLAIGAPQSGLEAEFTGQYFGPGYVRLHSAADGSLKAAARGAELGDQFGWSLADVGDRDGDGKADLLVGAPTGMSFLPEKQGRPGRVYLLSGADLSVLAAYTGQNVDDQFGMSLASIGDLDGDGLGEILIGAPSNDAEQTKPGHSLVVSGRAFAVE